MSQITGYDDALIPTAQAKRRSSLPSHPVSSKEHFKDTIKGLLVDHSGAALFNTTPRLSPETPSRHGAGGNNLDSDARDHKSLDSFESLDIMADKLQHFPFLQLKETDILQDADPWPSVPSPEDPPAKATDEAIAYGSGLDNAPRGNILSVSTHRNVDLPHDGKHAGNRNDKKKASSVTINLTSKVKGNMERLSKCLNERRLTIDIPCQEEEDIWGSHLAGLDQVEPWEDLNTAKQWVTSPLHSTKLEDLFPLFKTPAADSEAETKPTESSLGQSQTDEKIVDKQPSLGKVLEHTAITSVYDLNRSPELRKADGGENKNTAELSRLDNFKKPGEKAEKKPDLPRPEQAQTTAHQEEATRTSKRHSAASKPKPSVFSQRFHRQVSHEPCIAERNEQNIAPKQHRPYSLNLDLGNRCIRDISNQQNLDLADHPSFQRGAITPSETKHDGLSLELEMFLRDRQAPLRRNSAPVSVSSVRTAFMIKTCQAKAVPVIPPKVQYSHIPHQGLLEKGGHEQDIRENGPEKIRVEKADSLPPLQVVKDFKEERENCKPVTRIQRQASMEKPPETCKTVPAPEFPILRRKRSANGDSFMDCPRPERSSLLQRSSFRNRPRPQSLILFSPPFPIMDYHPAGEDGKLALSPIKSPAETFPLGGLTKEFTENLRSTEAVTLRNKMTLPRSGQRLETSTSCFYQPQRRSMIFDNRSSQQIE